MNLPGTGRFSGRGVEKHVRPLKRPPPVEPGWYDVMMSGLTIRPRWVRFAGRRLRRNLRRALRGHDRGATMLEWTLLLAAVALPSYLVVRLGLATLFAHYQLVTTVNGLPFP